MLADPPVYESRFISPPFRDPLPGMPPTTGNNVYAAIAPGRLSPQVRRDTAYLYIPDSSGRHTTIVDQRTLETRAVIRTGLLSQHVTPSYDLRTLYTDASAANRLVAVNPQTAAVERRVPAERPYNLYYTPDGRQAIVMAEHDNRIIFTDAHTFAPTATVADPSCDGPNHADFSANGRFLVVTCEFSGTLLKISTVGHRVMARLRLGESSMPQDIRISPDGSTFYVAMLGADQIGLIDWRTLKRIGSVPTADQPHSLTPSRDGRLFYVADRGAGKVSVLSTTTNSIVDTWVIPGGGSPDMGGVSADGSRLWLSGRYDGVVYGFDTGSGRLVARLQVGGSPHGLLVWPQPGRYSLGHNGNMR